MIDNFCKEFPNSVYIEKLTLAKKEVENYHEQKNKPIADDIKIIEKYNEITKFLDVLEKFKGKAVFVDLWGSWCGPCKKEFAYMPELKEYFKDKNLAYLYIANEQNSPNKEEKWLNMIKLHHLTGYHLIANKELLTDIWKQVATISDEELVNLDEGDKDVMQHIKAGKTQSYPTYLIINEKGEIIFKHAFKPSTKQKLYKQIEKVLEK
jgi:thiol-disulfide isomerase/thioredoxin